jgi:hypothetical protein
MLNLWLVYLWHGPARMAKTILLQEHLGLLSVLVYFGWCLHTCCTMASKLDILFFSHRQRGSRQRSNSIWCVIFFRCNYLENKLMEVRDLLIYDIFQV